MSSTVPAAAVSTLPAGGQWNCHQQSHSLAQRQEFLAAVDRLGNVAAAAKELGVNRSTCQKWANAAGIRTQRQYTKADKDHFYSVLDRAGNVTAVAQELGLNISTARNWAATANPAFRIPQAIRSAGPAPAERYGPGVIEDFLRLLREVGSVSVAARELGLNYSTCSNWAKAPGLVSVKPRRQSEKQVHYLRLRRDGTGRKDAALAVGASKPSS